MAVAEPYDTELTPAQKQSAVDMGLSNQPNQDSGFDPEERDPFKLEKDRLEQIQKQAPAAIRRAAEAEGEALRVKSQDDIARAEGYDAAAKQRSADVRGSYDAYGERIAKEPLLPFIPSEDNAETLGALFSGVNLIGLIMSRGAGRSSALGAMSSMTGMLEGYRTGRKDLYEREKQIFEKNYARIKDIHAQYGKELDQALKLSEVDFEGGKLAAELAAKRAGNGYAKKMAEAGNLKAVVAAFNAEVVIIKNITDLTEKNLNRQARLKIAADRAQVPGRQGQNNLAFASRVFNALSGAAVDLTNVSELKVPFNKAGGTGSVLAGLISSEPATVKASLTALAGRTVTEADKRLFDMLTGQIGAALSRIESQGLASGSTKANVDSFNALKPKAGDPAITLPFYLARVKQEIQTGYRSFRRMPGATKDQIADIEEVLTSLEAAVPFDLSDVYGAMGGKPLSDKAQKILNAGSTFNNLTSGPPASAAPAPSSAPASTKEIEYEYRTIDGKTFRRPKQ